MKVKYTVTFSADLSIRKQTENPENLSNVLCRMAAHSATLRKKATCYVRCFSPSGCRISTAITRRASPKIRPATRLSCSAVADLAVPLTSRNAVSEWQCYVTARRAFPRCRCPLSLVLNWCQKRSVEHCHLPSRNKPIINITGGGAAPSWRVVHPSSPSLPLFPCLRGRVEGCNPTCWSPCG